MCPINAGGLSEVLKILYRSPARVQEALLDPRSGRQYASVAKLEGVGHLVRLSLFFSVIALQGFTLQIPQEAPDELGSALYQALTANTLQVGIKPKL